MAKKKKAGPDLISLSELARRAGVTRAAVTMWVKQQEAQGIILAVPLGRQGKVVDANNKLVMRYINNTAGKSKRPGQDAGDAGSGSPNTLCKLQYQAEKLRLQNIALRKKYIPREAAFELFDKLLEFEKGYFDGFSDRILRRIEKELKIAITPESREKAKAYLDEAIQNAHITNTRIVEDFKRNTAPKHASEKTA